MEGNKGKDCSIIARDFIHCDNPKSCKDYFCDKVHYKNRTRPCKNGEDCTKLNCTFLHPKDKIESINCIDGLQCLYVDCTFNHPENWNPKICSDIEFCDNYDCNLAHLHSRKGPCMNNICIGGSNCNYLHKGDFCKNECKFYYCKKLHPKTRKGPCLSAGKCIDASCEYLHPKSRKICSSINDCLDYYCKYAHDKERIRNCGSGKHCWNYDCTFLHPKDRIPPCKFGTNCTKNSCEFAHPENNKNNNSCKFYLDNTIIRNCIKLKQIKGYKIEEIIE